MTRGTGEVDGLGSRGAHGLSPFFELPSCGGRHYVSLDAHHLADGAGALVAKHLAGMGGLGAGHTEGGDDLGVLGDGHASDQHVAPIGQVVAIEGYPGVGPLLVGGRPVEVGLSGGD